MQDNIPPVGNSKSVGQPRLPNVSEPLPRDKFLLKELLLVESMCVMTNKAVVDGLRNTDPETFEAYALAVARLTEMNSFDLLTLCMVKLKSGIKPGSYEPKSTTVEGKYGGRVRVA